MTKIDKNNEPLTPYEFYWGGSDNFKGIDAI